MRWGFIAFKKYYFFPSVYGICGWDFQSASAYSAYSAYFAYAWPALIITIVTIVTIVFHLHWQASIRSKRRCEQGGDCQLKLLPSYFRLLVRRKEILFKVLYKYFHLYLSSKIVEGQKEILFSFKEILSSLFSSIIDIVAEVWTITNARVQTNKSSLSHMNNSLPSLTLGGKYEHKKYHFSTVYALRLLIHASTFWY